MRPIDPNCQCALPEATHPTIMAHIGANHVPGFAKVFNDALMRAAPVVRSANGNIIAPNWPAVSTADRAESPKTRDLPTDVLACAQHHRLVDEHDVAFFGVFFDIRACFFAHEERHAAEQFFRCVIPS